MVPAARSVDILRIGPDAESRTRDVAAAEEPLEIRLGRTTFVVIMRTPGADRELAAGFLLSERVLDGPSEVAAIRYCSDDDGSALDEVEVDVPAVAALDASVHTFDAYRSGTIAEPSAGESRIPGPDSGPPAPHISGNVLNVWLTGKAAERAAARLSERRHVTANSSCGVCGRRSIDDLMDGIHPITSSMTVSREVVAALPDRLRQAQQVFEATGGLHAAGLFERDGRLVAVAEDVGRHNAVDKVLGSALLQGRLPLSDQILFVSGRTSFEIVQKAVVAGVPVVASVSAPSSLAIELAREANVTLLGFVRGKSFNAYTATERVTL